MSDNSSIPWCDASLIFATGCNKVSAGCANCYALEKVIPWLKRMGQVKYANGEMFTVHEEAMYAPLKWNKPKRIFVNSVSDTFHVGMPRDVLDKFFREVVQKTPQHTYLILTKRPQNMEDYFLYHNLNGGFYTNVWLGVTAENQEMANLRLPILNRIPAALRFVSVEPMLGPVDLSAYAEWLDWIIIGGESGPKQRVIPVKYIQDLVYQGKQMGIPVFLKQMHDSEQLIKEPYIWIEGTTEHKQYLEFPRGTQNES
jgi:protein gp37